MRKRPGRGNGRRTLRLSGVAAAALLAGLVPSVNSSAGAPNYVTSLRYSCAFPGGLLPVVAVVRPQFPETGRPGSAVQPGSVDVGLTLPRSAVAPGEGAAVVSVDADLAVDVLQGGGSSRTQWSGLTGPSVNVGAGSGDVTLGLSERPPTVTAWAGGDVQFTAGSLSLEVTTSPATMPTSTSAPQPTSPVMAAPATVGPAASLLPAPATTATATPSPSGSTPGPSSGTPSAPASPPASASASASSPASAPPVSAPVTTRATCTLDPGQQGVLGVVPVGGAGAGRAAQLTVPGVDSGVSSCPPLPTGSLDPRQLPAPPPGALIHTFPEQAECAFAVGWSDIGKQGEATAINDPYQHPALASLSTVRLVMVLPNKPNPYYEMDSLGNLTLPPSRTTFLTFGFMPTSATLTYVSETPLTVVATGWGPALKQASDTTISGYQEIVISNVKVNGVPLDVGPDCRTSVPVHLELHGRADSYLPGGGDGLPDYTVTAGGPLYQSDLYIPPFTGCGSDGQNYDALFTAAVSGSDNSLYFEQGPACIPSADYQCSPEIGLPDLPGIGGAAAGTKLAITPKARR